uniref:MORF/ORRM1/DAG-like MORF domain-containing protein n=1 Tax=Aegilops tauschii TaxID=37682 RepID=M8BIF9_AEGTA
MDKPGGEGASKHQMIDCYIHTLAKVLGSEEEAKRKIYNVSCERYFGFGCEIDEETSNKLEGIPGVLFVLPDSYVDPEHKDYGGYLFPKYYKIFVQREYITVTVHGIKCYENLYVTTEICYTVHVAEAMSRAVCEWGDCAEITREAEEGGARAAESVGQAEVQRQDPGTRVCP